MVPFPINVSVDNNGCNSVCGKCGRVCVCVREVGLVPLPTNVLCR